jgi:hypothetical protein
MQVDQFLGGIACKYTASSRNILFEQKLESCPKSIRDVA